MPDLYPCTTCHEQKPAEAFSWSNAQRRSDCKACANAKARQKWHANPGYYRLQVAQRRSRTKTPQHHHARTTLWKFSQLQGFTPEDYVTLFVRQEGRCGICQRPFPTDAKNKVVSVDHDHVTGEVRGLLCTGCNTAVGKLGDSVEGVLRAARYLRYPPARTYLKHRAFKANHAAPPRARKVPTASPAMAHEDTAATAAPSVYLTTPELYLLLNVFDESIQASIRRTVRTAGEAHVHGVTRDVETGAWVTPKAAIVDLFPQFIGIGASGRAGSFAALHVASDR